MTAHRGLRRSGMTIPELLITMAVFSLLLSISATVVTGYYNAYRFMDTSLPSERSQAHNLEFLMRYLSTVRTVYMPSSSDLKNGFSPNWTEGDDNKLFRFKRVDDNGKETLCALGYYAKETGLLLTEYPVAQEQGEAREQVLKTGPIALRTVQVGHETLFQIRLSSLTPHRRPIQTTITLKNLLFAAPLAKEDGKIEERPRP